MHSDLVGESVWVSICVAAGTNELGSGFGIEVRLNGICICQGVYGGICSDVKFVYFLENYIFETPIKGINIKYIRIYLNTTPLGTYILKFNYIL